MRRVGFIRKKKQIAPVFSGNCLIREFTGDGRFVGRCWRSTYDGICPTHGNVLRYLQEAGWPRDFELSKYDDNPWAERLRKEWEGR